MTILQVDKSVTVRDYIPGQPIPSLIRDPETNKVYVNPLKRYVKPFTLVTEPASITLAPGAISDPIPMLIDNKGHFEVMQAFFVSQRAAGFTVEIMDPENRPVLMNREVHVGTIASGAGVTTAYETFTSADSGGRPFLWPETFFMNVEDHGKALFCKFRNLSTQSNTIRFYLHGLRWYHAQAPSRVADRMQEIYRERFRTMPFFYTTEQFVTLAGLGSTEEDIRFTDEAWVELTKLMRVSTGRFNVLIREKASAKRFMNSAIRDDLVFGNGEFPFLMWESSLFEPNYKLTFEMTDLSGETNTIWVTLGCRKVFWDPKETRLARPGEAPGGEL